MLTLIAFWLSASLLTAIVLAAWFGTPQPWYRIFHVLHMWPVVVLVFVLAAYFRLCNSNPEDVIRD